MKALYYYCTGESHLATGKPCQDCAYAESTAHYSMAIVSDGHGGERYFRSQFGSSFLVKITKEALKVFASASEEGQIPLSGKAFTQFGVGDSSFESGNRVIHDRLMWLFSSIINQWNQAIAEHARTNELSQWEQEHVSEEYKQEFLTKRNNPDATFEKTYGCTLMAYLQTPHYWIAFQLGDGKLVTMHEENGAIVFKQPVPWDDRCFLNKTTSICDSDALHEFRYCYQGDGQFPIAAFLGSDGIDDSYGDGEYLNNFYANLFKQVVKSGQEEAWRVLRKSLPQISKVGSKDDMSVACVYDDSNLRHNFHEVVSYQKHNLMNKKEQVHLRITELIAKIDKLRSGSLGDNGQDVEYQYALKDQDKAYKLTDRIRKQMKELDGELDRFENNCKKMKPSKSVERPKTMSSLRKK